MQYLMKFSQSRWTIRAGILLTLTLSVLIGRIQGPVSISGWYLGSFFLGICFVKGLVRDCRVALVNQQAAQVSQS